MKRMPQGKKATCLLTLLICAAIVTTSTLYVQSHDKTLLRAAHRVAAMPAGTNRYRLDPEWISDHEAMFLFYHEDGDRFEFTLLNTDTRAVTPMVALNRRFAAVLRSSTHSGFSSGVLHLSPAFVLSPFRNHLIIIPRPEAYNPSQPDSANYHVTDLNATLDDRRMLAAQGNTFASQLPSWLPDNSRWVVPIVHAGRPGVQVFKFKDPHYQARFDEANVHVSRWLPEGVSASSRLWGAALGYVTSSIAVTEWDFLGGSPLHTLQIKSPVPGYVYGQALSPDGNRVAWLMLSNPPLQFSVIGHRLRKSVQIQTTAICGIWVSNLDGTNMKEVGHQDISHQRYNDNYIRWLPGGKKLAFHFGGGLYTIPVA